MHVVDGSDLPRSGTAARFEGALYGDVPVSFFINDSPPGTGPKLHRHPYAEVFIIEEGTLTFTVGDDEVVATAGQIAVVPLNTSHTFVNSGDGPARHIDIQATPRMVTEWLDAEG